MAELVLEDGLDMPEPDELDADVLVAGEEGLPVVLVVVVIELMELEGVIVPPGIRIDDVVGIVQGHVVTVTIAVAITVAVTL